MALANPCITCGEPTRHGTRCEECATTSNKMRIRNRQNKGSSTSRGYDSRWKRLSARARQRQPFCSDCGTTDDLQADHTPEAWKRHEKGLPIRLIDIDVVCGPCNRKRGAARGEHVRSDSKPTNTPQRVGGQP